MEKVEERVDTLEVVLSEFIRQAELDRKESRERMAQFDKRAELDRQKIDERMTQFEEKAELDRKNADERAERNWQKADERMNRFEQQAELDRKESRERMAQADERAKRDWQKIDERMTRFEEKAELDRKNADERAELDRQNFNEQIKRLTQQMARYQEKGERHIRDMNKQWGNLANKMGTIAEDISAPNMRMIAREYFGCDEIDAYGVRIERRNRNDRKVIEEFDVILSCGHYLFINETKSSVRPGYIDEFIAKLDRVFDYFPEHEGKRVVPVFSSLALTNKQVDHLTENKILAMAMGEGTMEVPNLESLLPTLRGE